MTSDTENSDSDLHIAVRYGDLKEVRQALEGKLSPNKIGLYQWSPLHEAASNGHSEIVKLLLKHGGNPNKADKLCANTAVHYAAVEGHPTCLRLLIEAGGDYSMSNNDGESAFDMATRACERVIEKKRVEELMRMPLKEAKRDAELDIHRIESAADAAPGDANQMTDTQSEADIAPINTSVVQERVKAWSPQTTKHDPATMGTLHMSFEYNSKKSYLKIRLWKLTGLLVSETNSTMINTLYVKSSLMPDPKKASKRKSEEVKLSTLLGKKRKPSQPYVTESGSEVTFEPITFKFSRPLVYEPITSEDVKNKVMYIQVSLKQKYTQRTYKIADLTIPMQVAVTRIVKEGFPLRICTQIKLPDTMMILADTKTHMTTASDPNLRHIEGTPLTIPKAGVRPASDVNLREILSVSSQSPSVSIDIPSDDEAQILNESPSQVKVEPIVSADVVVPMPGAIEGASEGENQLENVVVEPNTTTLITNPHHTVRVIVTNNDSDSSSEGEYRTPRTRLSSLFTKNSANQVVELESGQRQTTAKSTSKHSHDSISSIAENNSYSLVKHKLKPKPLRSTQSPSHTATLPQAFIGDSTRKEVVLSLGDLELQDLDEPVRVHSKCKKITAEQLV